MDADLKRDPETYAIIGATMEVLGELGKGFLEAAFEEFRGVEEALTTATD